MGSLAWPPLIFYAEYKYEINRCICISSLFGYFQLSQSIQGPRGFICPFLLNLINSALCPKLFIHIPKCHSQTYGITTLAFFALMPRLPGIAAKSQEFDWLINWFIHSTNVYWAPTMCGEHFVGDRQDRHDGPHVHHPRRLVGGTANEQVDTQCIHYSTRWQVLWRKSPDAVIDQKSEKQGYGLFSPCLGNSQAPTQASCLKEWKEIKGKEEETKQKPLVTHTVPGSVWLGHLKVFKDLKYI